MLKVGWKCIFDTDKDPNWVGSFGSARYTWRYVATLDKMVSVAKDFTIKDLRGLFIEANLLDKRSIIGAKQSYDIGKEKVHLSFTVEVIGDSDIYLTISNLSTFNVRLGGRLNIIQRMEASSISDRILLRLGKFQVNNGLTT